MVAFLFDISKSSEKVFYGDSIIKKILNGKEIKLNSNKVIISVGDIVDVVMSLNLEGISPYLIKDNLCTVEEEAMSINRDCYVVVLEDIEEKKAFELDKRLKREKESYIGMTSVDINLEDPRKQFWKSLYRTFSIEGNNVVYFGLEEEMKDFLFIEILKELNFRINYDNFSFEEEKLYSTRQSSFVKSSEQLNIIRGKREYLDRGLMEMNFSLVKEVEIAGVFIWKAIEDINVAYIPQKEDIYFSSQIFTSLYQAAQGIERLLKIIIEVLNYKEKYDREKIKTLLLGHHHTEMFGFICEKIEIEGKKIKLDKKSNKLLEILYRFYNQVRYHRFKFEENNYLELELIRELGKGVNEDEIKSIYGTALGTISQKLYQIIEFLARELNIFFDELSSNSVSHLVFSKYYGKNLYETIKKIEIAKKELLCYLMNKPPKFLEDFKPLDLESYDIEEYISDLIENKNSCYSLYAEVDELYDILKNENEKEYLERLEYISLLGNKSIFYSEEEYIE